MTQQQAQNRNYTIYRLRGQLNLFKNIPTDIVPCGFNIYIKQGKDDEY